MKLHHFKYTLLTGILFIGSTALFMHYSYSRLDHAKQTLAGHNLEKFRLQRDIEQYRQLSTEHIGLQYSPTRGSHDQRINWISSLQKARSKQKLAFLQYQISELHNMPLNELSSNSYILQGGLIDLIVHLKSIDQLSLFFQSLADHISTFDVRSCVLSQMVVENGKTKRVGSHIKANCQLLVLYTELKEFQ